MNIEFMKVHPYSRCCCCCCCCCCQPSMISQLRENWLLEWQSAIAISSDAIEISRNAHWTRESFGTRNVCFWLDARLIYFLLTE